MRGSPPKNFQSAARLILLISVLSGIFFSSGEGVQLIPFPVETENGKQDSFPFQDGDVKSYALSVHNLTNHSLSFKSKTQKHAKEKSVCGTFYAGFAYDWKVVKRQIEPTFQETMPFSASSHLNTLSDRAPPAV